MFKNDFNADLLVSQSVKRIWKSVSIWWSYGQNCSVLAFFDSQCRSDFFGMLLSGYLSHEMLLRQCICIVSGV